MRRRWLIAGAVGAVAVSVAALTLARGSGQHGDWVRAEKGDLILTVPITGVLAAVRSIQIGPPVVWGQWEFKIAAMAPEGADVKAGDMVLELDASERRRELERRRADRDAAREQLEKRRQELSLQDHDDALKLAEAEARLRTATLKAGRPDDLVPAKELQQVLLDLGIARKEVEFLHRQVEARRRAGSSELASLKDALDRAEMRVQRIEEAIGRMRVTAPQAGTVIYLTDWNEQKRKVGDTCWYADRVLELPDLDAMLARCEADEEDAAKLEPGQPVVLRLDAHGDIEYRARIRTVQSALQPKRTQPQLKVVRLELELETTDRVRMRPGMRVRGDVEVGRRRDVVSIPLDAVTVGAEGPVVVRKGWMRTERLAVRLGARNATRIEVLAGLADGDRVLLGAGAAP
ncbi:MAG: HlyD family efflux transporter periplasmic adaptor subunit [Thermoanaerobaculaceae bacterium]|nr:HlyD family efflux transporter periplasmic adaptor subunit [Thermoanaerobaculaceae bacterium]